MVNDTKKPHRRMGMAAIWMARDSGMSPMALADQCETPPKELPQWITVWFLKQANQMSSDELSRCLGLPPAEVSRMLCQLEHIRSTQAQLDEWMTRLLFRHTTMGGEAALPALASPQGASRQGRPGPPLAGIEQRDG